LEGEIGSLVVDENYMPETVDVPVDTLVIELTRDVSDDDENGSKSEGQQNEVWIFARMQLRSHPCFSLSFRVL
jgi:hypothetical protein